MINCPMFSLRSNSIESRYRSILGAIFSKSRYDFKKSTNNSEFASLIVLFLLAFARSRIKFWHLIYALLDFTY